MFQDLFLNIIQTNNLVKIIYKKLLKPNKMIAAGSPNFKITGEIDDPSKIDYDILGFHKNRTIVKGELVLVEYYRNYDGTTYSDLVVKETREYFRNPVTTLAYKRNQVTTWYFDDDSVGLELSFEKFYSPSESIAESITRRTNIIAEAKLYVLMAVGLPYAQDFMMDINDPINLYINGATQFMYDAVQNTDNTYITPEIKAGIMSIIDI